MSDGVRTLVALVTVVALGFACGGGRDTGGAGADLDGEALFRSRVLEGRPGCITCHSLEPGAVLVGPSLAGLAGRAGDTVPGLSAEGYLRQSIVEPDAHIVDGFDAGRMPDYWGDALSEAQIQALVSYLATLS